MYQTNISVQSHLNVSPVEFNPLSPHPNGEDASEQKVSSAPANSSSEDFGMTSPWNSRESHVHSDEIDEVHGVFEEFLHN
jgi:hypothetical protein